MTGIELLHDLPYEIVRGQLTTPITSLGVRFPTSHSGYSVHCVAWHTRERQ